MPRMPEELPYKMHCMDLMDLLTGMADGSVDAVITDPPYNVGINYGVNVDDDRQDYGLWCLRWFTELKRVCRGPIAISCGTVNIGLWHMIERPRWVLCWWKPACMGRSPVGFNNWEPIILYGKSRGKKMTDVVRAPILIDEAVEGHPCPKPVEWAAGQLEMLTRPGDTVLDPFMGSGTVGVACIRLGRKVVGCDVDERHASMTLQRMNEACGHVINQQDNSLWGNDAKDA